MPTMLNRTASLALLAALSLVSGCAHNTPVAFPPAADLAVEAKPRLDPEALDSDKALNDYDAAVEAWGERGWRTVGRLCRWAETMGAKVECPKAP